MSFYFFSIRRQEKPNEEKLTKRKKKVTTTEKHDLSALLTSVQCKWTSMQRKLTPMWSEWPGVITVSELNSLLLQVVCHLPSSSIYT